MAPSVESLCNQMARSRLLDGAAVRELRGQWRGQAGPAADNVAEFRKWLIEEGSVSEFQLDMLERGYGDFLTFGEYKLQERIGTGRMAGVYRAVHPLGQTVAIKVLPPGHAKEPRILGRFLREARMAIKVDHDNVVRAFHSGLHKDMYYIVMEHIDGMTLQEHLQRRRRLPLQEAVPILMQALAGLDHLHEIGLVHRDLKPGNLILVPSAATGASTADCTVKILDIGLGRALFDEGTPGTGGVNLTSDGAILGTLDYMAPEQARNAHAADIRADIYSLGCVLYEMLAGQPPFADPNFARQMRRHAEERPKPLAALVPGLPAGVDHIVQKMLAKDPAMRYAVPRQVIKDLSALALPAPPTASVRPMRSYLTWLESQPKDALPEQAPPAHPSEQGRATVPTAAVASPFNEALPFATPVLSADSLAAPTHNGAAMLNPMVPALAPVVAAGPLLTNPIAVFAKAAWKRIRAFGWSKRDWIAAAVGAGAILLVEGILWLADKLFGS